MAYPNTAHNNKWKLTFSNLPTITEVKDLKYLDNYVKSILLPDYNMEYSESSFKGEIIRNPISQNNDALSQIQIDMKISEGFENYYYLAAWINEMRYGSSRTEKIKNNYINAIVLNLLDGKGRNVVNISFTNAFLNNISSVGMESGIAEELLLTCNFSYEEVHFEKVSIFI